MHADTAAARPPFDRARADALGDEIAELSAHLDAATHRLLTRIREFDASGGWGAQGALTCAHWLSWRVGLDLRAAREKVRVARALGDMPLIDAALSRGEVSYSKVRAMTRVATPATEADLLEMARNSTANQLENICRKYRRVQRLNDAAAGKRSEREPERYVSANPTDDGLVHVVARLRPEEADLLMKAIDAAARDCDVAAGNCRGNDRAEGLMAIVEHYLAPSEQAPSAPRVEMTVRVDADALHADTDDAIAELDDGTTLSVETARRLACDCAIVGLVQDSRGTPLSVGRRTRSIPSAIRRALEERDRTCTFPGCTHRRFLDGHHIEHWANGGETSLDNLTLLCRRHHRYVHEHGWTIDVDDGALVFRDSRGTVVPRVVPRAPVDPGACDRIADANERAGAVIDHLTSLPNWDGRPADYARCVDLLCQRDSRGTPRGDVH